MSENSMFSEKYLHKNGPGAASAQGRKPTFCQNTPNKWLQKSPSFMALAQMFFGTDEKKQVGADLGPHQK